MTQTNFATTNTEGIDFTQIYNGYIQTSAVSSTNSPDYPGMPFVAGTEVVGANNSIWVFTVVDTSATLAQGNVCIIDPLTFKAKPIIGGGASEAYKYRVGFYQNSTSATAGQGCWLMISGVPTISVSGAPVKGVQLYTTDTSGTLDDAVATGSQYPVRNVFMLTTVSGATATTQAAQASWPSVGPIGSLT
jgi:hypothetical protein